MIITQGNYKVIVDQILNTRTSMLSETENSNTQLPLWRLYYAGYDPNFHAYNVYTANKCRKQVFKKTLKMGKKVCEDWASLLWSEKVQVVNADKEKLDNLLASLKFWSKGNRATEVGFALGHSALVVEIKHLEVDNGIAKATPKSKLVLNYYTAIQSIPITFENGEITEIAFVSENSKTLNINIHLYNEETDEYHIYLYRKDKKSNEETIYDFNTGTNLPLFAIIRPNIENNLYLSSEYPLSILANAIPTLQAIDNKYDSFDNEYVLGRKRIYISSDLRTKVEVKDADGNIKYEYKDTFDPSDTITYTLPNETFAGTDSKPLIYSPNDPLRGDQIIQGINIELKLLATKVGLGNDYYTFDKSGVATATQVISEKSDTFRNVRKHELLLDASIRAIVKAIIYCNNTFTLNERISDAEEPQVIFDDSVIEDKESEIKRDRADLEQGILSKVDFRKKWYGEDEDTAKDYIYDINGRAELIKRANEYLPLYNSGLMTDKMFINLVYTDEDLAKAGVTRDELIAELGTSKSLSNPSISEEDILGAGGYNPAE